MGKITLKITKKITILCSLMLVSFATAQTPEGTWTVSSLGVGPSQGDTGWWNNNVASGDRACYYDDTYVFNADGSFANVLGGETWREGWQGVAEGCGAPVAPHDGTNAATYTYDAGAGTLTIVGLGAYIGLPKVHNGGETGSPANNTITYTVTSISETEMTLDISVGGGWWRFVMTKGGAEPTQTVFERLQGNVYRQIESPEDCGSCEEEINYYMFQSDGLRIIGTTYDGTCEQDDFQPIGDCSNCAYITANTSQEFTVCTGSFIQLCQTITYLSETEIQFDFPFFNQTWTAQLYEDTVPCLGDNNTDFSPEGTWTVSSLGVGPNQGDTGWWNNNINSGDRACYYDDTYVFNADGSFANVLGGETWLEGWQGVAEGCGTPVAPHDGTNAATYTYDQSGGTITIVGEGAYIGLPKVHNGGETGSPANNTITYTVSSSSETEMTLDIDVGGGWWRFVLQKQATAGLNDNVYNNVKMFPNPANDYLNFATNSNEDIDVQIFDIIGKSVLRLEDVRESVDISELKSGVYFVQITLGAGKATKKLIIN